jgi:hypothetical protein
LVEPPDFQDPCPTPTTTRHPTQIRNATKPGSLLKDAISIRTWAQWDDAVPGFVEIGLVGHEGGNAVEDHCYTLTVTDIATGWTEECSVKNKAQKWVFKTLLEITEAFPIPGIDSDWGVPPTFREAERRGRFGLHYPSSAALV